jgi:hypothetical protein
MMETFNVIQFFPDGQYEEVATRVDPATAVRTARDYSQRPAAAIGITARIIITGSDDSIVFEWKFGQGVTFPPRENAPR